MLNIILIGCLFILLITPILYKSSKPFYVLLAVLVFTITVFLKEYGFVNPILDIKNVIISIAIFAVTTFLYSLYFNRLVKKRK